MRSVSAPLFSLNDGAKEAPLKGVPMVGGRRDIVKGTNVTAESSDASAYSVDSRKRSSDPRAATDARTARNEEYREPASTI